eukprot:CAMPEP_0194670234 /NCGR_PEP_ID=MMETSP0295-20121207/5077_1 /TAXON_ID=39354 /ORGANISM="Heterosigma akashiwo, Strain CCMP2393" /LENGTH=71 /DNA_ID=CAMNT_0039553411 /DNA_START=345 /DNA_END=556 /DNA_ORIENTATION=-
MAGLVKLHHFSLNDVIDAYLLPSNLSIHCLELFRVIQPFHALLLFGLLGASNAAINRAVLDRRQHAAAPRP